MESHRKKTRFAARQTFYQGLRRTRRGHREKLAGQARHHTISNALPYRADCGDAQAGARICSRQEWDLRCAMVARGLCVRLRGQTALPESRARAWTTRSNPPASVPTKLA